MDFAFLQHPIIKIDGNLDRSVTSLGKAFSLQLNREAVYDDGPKQRVGISKCGGLEIEHIACERNYG